MGYKLAGFEVVGGVEIDPEMMTAYRRNHNPNPALSFLMGVQDFAKLETMPTELSDIDILDGSPPCSVFSTNGKREEKWGEMHAFREGQTTQKMDDLFFEFIKVADRLKPKVVVAENVKGLILGNAKGYVREIFKAFDAAGYDTQLFLLNAAFMGVPQKRERVFFVARRKDLNLGQLKLDFDETPISARIATAGASLVGARSMTPESEALWRKTELGKNFASTKAKQGQKATGFSRVRLNGDMPAPTVTAGSGGDLLHWAEPRTLSHEEIARLQTFPVDFDFGGVEPGYVCGMSVPPLMTQRLAGEIARQFFGVQTEARR